MVRAHFEPMSLPMGKKADMRVRSLSTQTSRSENYPERGHFLPQKSALSSTQS